MQSPTRPPELPDEAVNARELLFSLWNRRHHVWISGFAGLALAAIYAFALAVSEFESTALLVPTQPPTVDQLGAAASLLGRKNSTSTDMALYQSLLTSRTVLEKLLLAPIENRSDTGKGSREPLYRVMQLDTSDRGAVDDAVEGLARSVTVNTKETGAGGLLEIRFCARTPWLVQQMGNRLLSIGQDELRQVRIRRSDLILSRLGPAVTQARAEWDQASSALTGYSDRNRSITLQAQMLELSRLEMEKSAKEQKYLLARKELETQALERAKAAPPMMILDPADLPVRKSRPKRGLLMALGLMLGLFGSVLVIVTERAFRHP